MDERGFKEEEVELICRLLWNRPALDKHCSVCVDEMQHKANEVGSNQGGVHAINVTRVGAGLAKRRRATSVSRLRRLRPLPRRRARGSLMRRQRMPRCAVLVARFSPQGLPSSHEARMHHVRHKPVGREIPCTVAIHVSSHLPDP